MLHIDIITCLPQLLSAPLQHSVLRRAQEHKLLSIQVHNLREYSVRPHQALDDYPYGGGGGMVLQIEPIDRCLLALQKASTTQGKVIFLSPDGESFTQTMAHGLSLEKHLILLCGHYKGIDERVREHLVAQEISIGDYVLSGGEWPAMVVCDAVTRLIPGVLGDAHAALSDSFQDDLVAPPLYTRPPEYKGMKVPEILRSGHQARIDAWRFEQSLARTKARRPQLLSDEEKS